MTLTGRVNDGLVELEAGAALPDGAAVTVIYPALPKASPAVAKRRIQVPLVHTGAPGTVPLTSARIAEIMDAEDASAGH